MKLSKWFRRTLIVLALVAVGVGGLYAFLQSQPGRDTVDNLIESLAASDNLTITIDGLDGPLPGSPRAAKVTIADATGPWLVLHDVSLSWSPLALIGGDIVADDVSVKRLEWLRLPAESAEASDGEGGLPSLSIGKLTVTTAVIAPEVAGQGGTFSITGAADTRNPTDRATLSLLISELVEGGARAKIDARYEPAKSLLDLDAAINDRAGGALATMLQLPADAPLTVALKSEGTLDDWRAKLTATGGTALGATGDATIVRQAEWRELTLSFTSDVTDVGPERLRPLYNGHSTIEIVAALSDTNAWRVARLDATTPALTLTGNGSFDAAAQRAEGSGTLTVPRGDAIASLIDGAADWRDLTVTVKTEGAWPKPSIVLDLRAADVAAEDIRASAVTGRIALTPDRRWDDESVAVAIAATLDAAEMTADDETIRGLLGPSATMTFQAMLIERQRLSGVTGELKTSSSTLRFAGDADERALNGVVSLNAPSLAQAGFRSGAVAINATIEANLEASRWTVEGKGTATDVASGGAVDALLAGKQDLTFALQGTGPGHTQLSSLALRGERLSLIASGDIVRDALNLDAEATIANLNALSAEHEGRANIDVRVAGTTDAPRLSGKAALSAGKLFGRAVQTLNIDLAEADAKGMSRLTIKGDYDERPVDGAANVAWRPEGGARIEALNLVLDSLTLNGDATVEGAGLINGAFAIDARDLAEIAPFIGVNMEGALAGTLRFAASGDRQSINLALTGPSAVIEGTAFDGIAITGTIGDLFGNASPNLRVRAAFADFDGFDLEAIDATARGPLAALEVNAKAQRAGTAISTRVTLKLESEPNVISIAALQLTRGDKTARLASPVTITMRDGRILIPTTRILAGGGSITLAGDAGTTMDIGLTATSLPLWVAAFATDPLPITGTASGTARIREAGATSFDMKVVNLAPEADPRIVRNVTLTATGKTDRSGVDFKLTLADPARTSFQATGRVPFAEGGPLNININGSADLALANAYLSVTGDRARGAMSVSALITGTRAAPRIAGTGKIANGLFRSAASGFELRDFTADFVGSERHVAVNSIAGKAANGGAITGRGEISLDPANNYPMNISVKANDAQLVSTELTTVIADVDARMVGGLTANGSITGTADVELWEIRLPQRLSRPLTPIRVKHVNAPPDIAATLPQEPAEEEAQSSITIGLDITVHAPRRVHVRGQGITAEFGGQVKASGSVDRPEINGRFDLRRGTVELLSQRLALTRGRITFAGDVVPILDIVAEARKSDVTASIGVKGRATTPEISLTSTPTLPQDEIMSRILFDKSTQQLSAFEAVQLAGAIARLSGLASGPGILDRLRTSLGIDSLGAVTDTAGGTAVSAGSYVGSGVYLGFVQGTDTTAGRATVDVDLTDDIKLRGEAGPSGDTRLGVVAEWEY
jgi:translocation and assembly module TamB